MRMIRVDPIPLIMSAFLWTTSEAWQEILVGIRQKSCKCVRKKSRWRQRVIVSIFPDLAFVSTAWLISNAGGQSSKLGFEKNLHNQSWLGSDGVGAGLLIQYHPDHHHCHLHGHHLSLSSLVNVNRGNVVIISNPGSIIMTVIIILIVVILDMMMMIYI